MRRNGAKTRAILFSGPGVSLRRAEGFCALVLFQVTVFAWAAGVFAQPVLKTRLVPVAEGWAKNQVNAVIFRKNSLTTFGENQYAAFYDAGSKVVVARRRLESGNWQISRTQFSGDTADAHNSISLAVDGEGFLHLAWNHHNVPLQYSRSSKRGSAEFPGKTLMTGADETRVSYPEFYNLPDGNLLFLYRDGASGNGRLVLNGYDAKAGRWSRLQSNLIDGEGERNAYPQMTVDARGTIHLSWVWRESPDVASNHDLCYAKSADGGKTWLKSSGEKYRLPITAGNAEYVQKIPQNSELINQTSMAADAAGRAYIATYWRDAGSAVPQFRLVYFDGEKWHSRQISDRRTAFSLSGRGTKRIPVSRPQILVDSGPRRRGATPRAFVIFRDAERGNRISAAVCDDLKNGEWRVSDLAGLDVGMWEPTFDAALWARRGEIHLFVQRVGQGDAETVEDLPPQMVSVLEVRAGR